MERTVELRWNRWDSTVPTFGCCGARHAHASEGGAAGQGGELIVSPPAPPQPVDHDSGRQRTNGRGRNAVGTAEPQRKARDKQSRCTPTVAEAGVLAAAKPAASGSCAAAASSSRSPSPSGSWR